MHLIRLKVIDSTNSYLRQLCLEEKLSDYTVVTTDVQKKGRGQMGSDWEAAGGLNLTCSVYKKISCLLVEQQFYISMAVSLAVLKYLKSIQVPMLSIKWPNDILSGNTKICGILIENIIKKRELSAAIIGIGLNVNQTVFEAAPHASSLKLIKGITFNLDELLSKLMAHLKHYGNLIETGQFEVIHKEYHHFLFRKDKPSTFKTNNDQLLMGFIKGVSPSGKLNVLLEDDILQEFDLKELQLLY
jgi:BirA family biotin operon repressor/biotin-[acetyl-CoA-carboxylase] ligase